MDILGKAPHLRSPHPSHLTTPFLTIIPNIIPKVQPFLKLATY